MQIFGARQGKFKEDAHRRPTWKERPSSDNFGIQITNE